MSCSKLIEHNGELILFLGPMFSSKSTRLIAELTTCADLSHQCLFINHSSDVRETAQQEGCVTTHHSSFRKMSEKITQVKLNKLSDLQLDISRFDVIGVDELQFFCDADEVIRHWVIDLNKTVYCASLNGDFRMQPFGQTHLLISLASNIIMLSARCTMCQRKTKGISRPLMIDAHFTGKIGGDKNKIVDIGAENLYQPLCISCHKQNSSGIKVTEPISIVLRPNVFMGYD